MNKKSKDGPLSLKEIFRFISGKGRILLLIFICVPFCQIFGLAIPFGLMIAYLGFGYAFVLKTWIPKFILKKKVPSFIVKFVFSQILWFFKIIEKISHPRLLRVCNQHGLRIINGCLIFLIGIFIAISLPIPLSGYFSTAALLFLGVGLLNDDGVLVLIGYPIAIFYICFVIITLDYISIPDLIRRFL